MVAEEEGGETVAGWNRGSGREATTATPQSQDGRRRHASRGEVLFVNLDCARVSFWFGGPFCTYNKDFKALQFLGWTNRMRFEVLLLIIETGKGKFQVTLALWAWLHLEISL